MPDLGAVPLFYSARPRVSIDGSEDIALSQGVINLFAEEDCEGLARAEIAVGNWGSNQGSVDFLYFARDVLDFGRSIRVELGAGDAAGSIFDGVITGLEGRFPKDRPPEILVLAEDRMQNLRMTRRSRSFEDATVADVASTIASDHGLTGETDVDGPSYRMLAQLNQSDLAFLRDLARRVDAEVWVEGATLKVVARARRQGEALTLTYGQGLRDCQILADLAGQRSSVGASGWDVQTKAAIESRADSAALSSEVRGTSGVSLLASAIDERHEQLVHVTPRTTEEATAMAEAHLRQLARRFVTGHGIAEGDSRLRVGSRVSLRGVGPLFDGDYSVFHARHRFDAATGFVTHFGFERPDIEAEI